jgi:hypothetical protein
MNRTLPIHKALHVRRRIRINGIGKPNKHGITREGTLIFVQNEKFRIASNPAIRSNHERREEAKRRKENQQKC